MELTINKQKVKKIDTNTPNHFFPTKRIISFLNYSPFICRFRPFSL